MSHINPWGNSNETGGKLEPDTITSSKDDGSSGKDKAADPPPGNLIVQVMQAQAPHKALADIKVTIAGPQPKKDSQDASTNKAGEASFNGLKPGSYNITVKGDDVVTAYSSANVDSDRTARLVVEVEPALVLRMQFREYLGDSRPSILYELWQNGKKVMEDDSFFGKVEIPFSNKNGDQLVDPESEATLVVQVKRRGVRHGKPQKIKLHFMPDMQLKNDDGGVNVAILQMVLTNLGYPVGPCDDEWNESTQAAVRAFQADHKIKVSGIPDSATVSKLIEKSENPFDKPSKYPDDADSVFTGGNAPDLAPATGAGTGPELGEEQWYEKGGLWDPYDGFIDRAAPYFADPTANKSAKGGQIRIQKGDETALELFDHTPGLFEEDKAFDGVPLEDRQKSRFFNSDAYVRPAIKSNTDWKNDVWMLKYRMFLCDCGGWTTDLRDFAVIYGWHCYLCQFDSSQKPAAGPAMVPDGGGEARLDQKFFTAMGASVKVKSVVSTVWGSRKDFDWSKMLLVIPDFHLMTIEGLNYYKPNQKDGDGRKYADLGTELDFFQMARSIVESEDLAEGIQVIHLGDTYDLWVGSPDVLGHKDALYEDNQKSLMKFRPEADIKLKSGEDYASGKKAVGERWADALGGSPKTDGVDMRVQVLRWWIEAIQGKHDSPLESGSDIKLAGMNWVEWGLSRSSKENEARLADLSGLQEKYRSGLFNAMAVLEYLKSKYPDQASKATAKYPVGKDEPNEKSVNGWIAEVGKALAQFNDRAKGFVQYVQDKNGGIFLNPAEIGLRMLEAKFGPIQVLYGNHDNLMILPGIVDGITQPRLRYIDLPGVFIEHCHRLEPQLAMVSTDVSIPGLDLPCANYDGCQKGFDLANVAWDGATTGASFKKTKDVEGAVVKAVMAPLRALGGIIDTIKDAGGKWADSAIVPLSQIAYRHEFGRYHVARYVTGKPMVHIFVIGHTHAAKHMLQYVNLNDATDIRGPGSMAEG